MLRVYLSIIWKFHVSPRTRKIYLLVVAKIRPLREVLTRYPVTANVSHFFTLREELNIMNNITRF